MPRITILNCGLVYGIFLRGKKNFFICFLVLKQQKNVRENNNYKNFKTLPGSFCSLIIIFLIPDCRFFGRYQFQINIFIFNKPVLQTNMMN